MSERTYTCDKCGTAGLPRCRSLPNIEAEIVRWGIGLTERTLHRMAADNDSPVLCEQCVEMFSEEFRRFCGLWFLGPYAKALDWDRYDTEAGESDDAEGEE